jgi:hypothetical protein
VVARQRVALGSVMEAEGAASFDDEGWGLGARFVLVPLRSVPQMAERQ